METEMELAPHRTHVCKGFANNSTILGLRRPILEDLAFRLVVIQAILRPLTLAMGLNAFKSLGAHSYRSS